MRRCGIDSALVVHTLARDYDPKFGNRVLIEEVRKSERLFPCFVLMPDGTGEFPEIESYIEDNEIRAVKLYPKLHKYMFDEFTCGKIFKLLEEMEIPLFIEAGRGFDENFNQASIEEIDRICSVHPNLKLVIQGSRWEMMRKIFYLMKKHENIYIEFSSLQVNRGIEYFVENFGSGRLLFGTEFPYKSIGSARAFIDYSDISIEDRRRIAGLNLAKLLKVDKLPSLIDEDSGDEVLRSVKSGRPLNKFTIIDAHAHICQSGYSAGYTPLLRSDADSIFQRDRKLGIEKCCISSWLAIWLDHKLGNEVTLEAVESYPDHFIGYAVFDPVYVEDWDRELELYFTKWGFLGIKPYYPRTRIPYNDKRWAKLFEFGDAKNLFVLLHPSEKFIEEVEEISKRYPNLKFLLAHSGMSFAHARDVVELAKLRDNVYLEITFTEVPDGVIEFMVREAGSHKVIFGTDQPMRDPAPQLGWVAYARIGKDDRLKILGLNMLAILKGVRISKNT
jgi:predicted TIM-barrel fold metal-dependent hydrolase